MAYSANRGYRSGVSYSFSSRPANYISSDNIHMGYTNNFDVSYSRRAHSGTSSNFNYIGGGSKGINYNTKAGNSFLGRGGGGGGRGMGSRGSGRGAGRGKGINSGSKGQGKGISNKGQRDIDMQNQFIVEEENNNPLTEVDLAIKNLSLSDSPQNQIITQEISQLEIAYYKKITFIKKQSRDEHLEVIIKEVELLNKKFKKNTIR